MLAEVLSITQREPGKHRRWFRDDFFDLYVWQDDAGDLLGFQLCYDKRDAERALRWNADLGYRHEGVDAPEDKPGRAMSAIFVADGVFDAQKISEKFAAVSGEMPEVVRAFVLAKIRGVGVGR